MTKGTRLNRLLQLGGLFAVALLVLVDGAAAQGGRGPGQGRGLGPGGQGPALLRDSLPGAGPIQLLLAQRDSMQLTAAQVTQLRQMDEALRQQNAPLVRTMLELRREVQDLVGIHPRNMTAAQREQFVRQAARARPIMEQVQQNNRRAMERVSELLTAEQKRRLRGLVAGARLQRSGLPER